MSKKHEAIQADSLFYAFVDLEPEVPVTYIVPSGVVADVLQKAHQTWVETPGKGGRPHDPDSTFRRLRPDFPPGYAGEDRWLDLYKERWELLEPA